MHLIAGQDGEGKKWQVEQQEQEQERGEEREVKKEWIALVSARVGKVIGKVSFCRISPPSQTPSLPFVLEHGALPLHQPPQPPSSELYTADETLPSRFIPSCPVLREQQHACLLE